MPEDKNSGIQLPELIILLKLQEFLMNAKISYQTKNAIAMYVREDAENKFMDYYYKTILPDTSIPQELKDAWVYQTKKRGNWK